MPDLAVIPKLAGPSLPALIADAGERAALRFIEKFTVNIRNKNTRAAYARAAADFLNWCERQGINELGRVHPVHVAAYIELLQKGGARLPRSSNISPVFGCCSTGSSSGRSCRRTRRTPSAGRVIR
jgi:hypothetical protein